jgi:serine/threonine protein kinase
LLSNDEFTQTQSSLLVHVGSFDQQVCGVALGDDLGYNCEMNCPHCAAPIDNGAKLCPHCQSAIQPKIDPMIGQLIHNEFRIIRKLGEGGFGAVYEAEQITLGRKIAVKTLHKHLSASPSLAARFRREGVAASKLSHPSAVKIVSFGETPDGLLWLAMEFIEGRSLKDHLKEQRAMPAHELVGMFSSLCEVLEEAHGKGIVHRDLKPENIMLAPLSGGKLLVKVLDFGIAALVEDGSITKTGVISGTPQYMPPEQWKGLRFTDARSDIYSLGVIAYQCLSGALPFEADSAPEWLQKHCFTPPTPLQDRIGGASVPPTLLSVVMRALEKEPADRQQSAMQLKQELEASLQGISIAPPKAASVATQAMPPLSAPPAIDKKLQLTEPIPKTKSRWRTLWLVPVIILGVLLFMGAMRRWKSDSRRGEQSSCDRGEIESCQQLCTLDVAQGCFKLGHMYYLGQGAPQDLVTGIQMYQRACDLGNTEACYTVSSMYQTGVGGIPLEPERGKALQRAFYAKRECDRRSASACLELMSLYNEGKFVTANPEIAKKFKELACKYGDKTSCQ